jgi:GT2 family glycosyltransferase
MSNPWLSVVMPTYNGEAYIGAALSSVMAQDCRDLEVLAVDDGSTDRTPEILEAFAQRLPLTIVRRERVGNWVANSNHGLALARGEFACFLHQDDRWAPNRLSMVRRLVERHPAASFFLHASWFIDTHGRRIGLWRCPLPRRETLLDPEQVVERLLVQNFISMPAPLFRREEALRAGGLNEQLWYTADWDLWLTLAAAGRTVYCPKALSAFRIHPASQTVRRSQNNDEIRRQSALVLDKHLKAWEEIRPVVPSVRRAARYSVEANAILAACAQGNREGLLRLACRFVLLGPEGWYRFLRDSRIVERCSARVCAGLAS